MGELAPVLLVDLRPRRPTGPPGYLLIVGLAPPSGRLGGQSCGRHSLHVRREEFVSKGGRARVRPLRATPISGWQMTTSGLIASGATTLTIDGG